MSWDPEELAAEVAEEFHAVQFDHALSNYGPTEQLGDHLRLRWAEDAFAYKNPLRGKCRNCGRPWIRTRHGGRLRWFCGKFCNAQWTNKEQVKKADASPLRTAHAEMVTTRINSIQPMLASWQYQRDAAYKKAYNLAMKWGFDNAVAKQWGRAASAECAMRIAC